jgi:hypothetical protein
MASDITKGRLDTPSKTGVGGVKAFYFANFEPLIYKQFEKTAGLVTSLLTSPATPLNLYKYELRSSGHNLEDANENSEETGTSFVTSTFTAILKQIGATTRDELQLASFGRPQVIVEDYNGNFLLVGIENGCTVSVNQVTGSAMGELSGYNLTITAQEREMSYLIDPTIIGDDTQTTIVVGT